MSAPAETLFADEYGIWLGVLGQGRIRTLYRPVFERRAAALCCVALAAETGFHQDGQAVSREVFAAGCTAGEQALVEPVAARLHIRNCAHAGDDEPVLQLPFHAAPDGVSPDAPAEIEELLREAAAVGLPAGRIVFDLTGLCLRDHELLGWNAALLRVAGARFLLDLAVLDDVSQGPRSPPRPAVVRVSAPWFRTLYQERVAAKLLSSLAGQLHERGLKVQIEGVDQAEQLALALASDADFFAGDLLGAPALAGCARREEPHLIAALLDAGGGKIVPIGARRRAAASPTRPQRNKKGGPQPAFPSVS